jgi:hypothetical protein
MLRIQLVWRNAGSSMNSCQTALRLSGSVRTYPRSGIADIESTERYRRRQWVTAIGWVMGCCPCLTCETHSCSRVLRGEKILSGAGGMKVGSSPLPLGFVFVFAERRLRLNEARSGLVRFVIVELNNVAFAMFGCKRVGGHMYACTKITAQSDRHCFQGDKFQTKRHEWWMFPPVESGRPTNASVLWALHVGDLVPKIAVPPFP